MRKFLFITVILLSFQGKAQMWFANGAEWHYYVNYFSISAIGHSGNGHYKISVTNSLTIAGDTCFELSRKFTGIPTWPTYPPVVNVDKGFVTNNGNIQVPFNNLNAGLYFLSAYIKNELVQSNKIIKIE
jgi:hypothetical protein